MEISLSWYATVSNGKILIWKTEVEKHSMNIACGFFNEKACESALWNF